MSEETILYGAIIGRSSITEDPMGEGLFQRNSKAVQSLPTSSAYPTPEKDMFVVPQKSKNRSIYYRNQVIHFGASYNNFSEYWHIWLEDFEKLLKQMYWSHVFLHLDIELYGIHFYEWEASTDSIIKINNESDPKPVEDWKFQGGPRSFDE